MSLVGLVAVLLPQFADTGYQPHACEDDAHDEQDDRPVVEDEAEDHQGGEDAEQVPHGGVILSAVLIVTAGPLFWGRPPLSCLPREERQEVVASLRESGLSIRAIASATGTGTRQVQEALRDREVCSENTPEPITGTDGKTYTPKPADYFPVERLQRITAGWSIGPATPDCA